MWQATQGMFYELDTAAILLLSVGFIVLGVSMSRAPGFGARLGGLSVALGAASLAETCLFGVTSVLAVFLLIPVFIVLPIILGWKVYALSRVWLT
jgi:hypothetical protein